MALGGIAVQEASPLALHQVRLPVFAGDVGRCHAGAALLTVCAMPQQRLYDDQISLHGSPMEQRVEYPTSLQCVTIQAYAARLQLQA